MTNLKIALKTSKSLLTDKFKSLRLFCQVPLSPVSRKLLVGASDSVETWQFVHLGNVVPRSIW